MTNRKRTLFLIIAIIICFANNVNSEINDSTKYAITINKINNNLKIIETNKSFETDSFIRLAHKTLALSKEYNYDEGINTSYLYIANILEIRNKYDSAITYYQKGLEYTKDDNNRIATYYYSLARLYLLVDDYSNALEKSIHLKEMIESEKTDRFHYSVYNLLGLIYQSLMEYDLAKENYKKSAKLALADSNEAFVGVIYANIGKLLYEQDSIPEALNFYKKGKKYFFLF